MFIGDYERMDCGVIENVEDVCELQMLVEVNYSFICHGVMDCNNL